MHMETPTEKIKYKHYLSADSYHFYFHIYIDIRHIIWVERMNLFHKAWIGTNLTKVDE